MHKNKHGLLLLLKEDGESEYIALKTNRHWSLGSLDEATTVSDYNTLCFASC
jgi:hypothetical protein